MHTIPPNTLFLIDGSALLYRSYYGLRPLKTSHGHPTQATYGFCRTIKKLIDDFDPHDIMVVWDSKGKTWREDVYQEYKKTRQAPPSDLFQQKEDIITFLEAIKLQQVVHVGYEADDLIAGIIDQHPGRSIVIVGPDKDLYQLISDYVVILDPFKNEIIDQEAFKKKHGFEPERLPLFYALVGDTSDNIPGVTGIGKKTAGELAQQFSSLNDVYKNLDTIANNRVRTALETYKEDAFLSLKLFLLKPYHGNTSKKEGPFDKMAWHNAAPFFKTFEFKSLLKTTIQSPTFIETQGSLSVGEIKKEISVAIHSVQSAEALKNLKEKLLTKKIFAFDTETTGLNPLNDSLVGISFAYNEEEAYYLPLGHKTEHHQDQLIEQQIPLEQAIQELKSIFESAHIIKILHNAKFDQLVLNKVGIVVHGVTFDTLIAASLLRKDDTEKINLKTLSLRYLDEKIHTFKETLGNHKDFAHVSLEQAASYAAYDALQTFKLSKVFGKEFSHEPRIKHLFETVEMPFNSILYDMELKGIYLNVEKLAEVKTEVKRALNTIQHKIEAAVKHHRQQEETSINLNSPQQLEKLLFDELKLPAGRLSNKGQRSTDHEVLKKLSDIHPIPGMIITYRELFKLLNTYLEPLPQDVNPFTGRVHTSYSQTLVTTGRLSSSDPNLQNIPASPPYGIKIRSAFEAPSGYTFISADYSQVELRILADLSKDPTLLDIFKHEKDIHQETASQIFNVTAKEVTHEQRQIGKRINFSIMYGISPYGLSKDIGITSSQAKLYIEKFFERYPKVLDWMDVIVEGAKKNGYVETLLGRRRYVPNIKESNQVLFGAAKRIAINTPVQGTQAELMKLAMLSLDEKLKKMKSEAKMILQIHDELILEVPDNETDEVAILIKKTMESAVSWDVPLKVTLRTGKNWGDITK